jgi:hypothetical protein
MKALLVLLAATIVLAAPALAGVTTTTKVVGGPGTFSSCGPGDPPTLCDGVTLASALFTFTFDDTVTPNLLTVEVSNTSPVVPGVPNPILSAFWFNVPALAATQLTLVSQTAPGEGGTSSFGHEFDPDLNDGSNPVTSPGFCAFNSKTEWMPEVAGGIANPLADTFAIPPSFLVFGPVTFVYQVGGPASAGVQAPTFASAFSQIPPGDFRVNVVAKFKHGGLAEASGSLSNRPTCEAGNWMVGEPRIGCDVTFVMSGAPGCFGCLAMSPDPGPTVIPNPPFGDLVVPLGSPTIAVLVATVPPATVKTKTIPIPPDANLVGGTLYFAAVLLDGDTGQLSVGSGFSITLLPAGPCP